MLARSAVALAAVLVMCAASTKASASELTGSWSATSLRVSWSIGDWSKGCGPRPSGGGESGGTVTLTPSGEDFQLSGLGRNYRSTQCWERMPGLSARGHSASGSVIQTTCRMPAGDPRQAKVVTTWHLRGDEIYFDETGQYEFTTGKNHCTASARRTRVLRRIVARDEEPLPLAGGAKPTSKEGSKDSASSDEDSANPEADREMEAPTPADSTAGSAAAVPPKTTAPPEPRRASNCDRVGAPTSYEVSPRTKLMRQGESFAFEALARDDKGCRTAAKAKWRVVSGGALGRVDAAGRFTVKPSGGTGTTRIEVLVGGQTLFVTAKVVSEKEFEALLANGGYGALGESRDAATLTVTTSTVEVGDIETENQAPETVLLALVALLSLVLGSSLFILLRRHRTAPRAATARRAGQMGTPRTHTGSTRIDPMGTDSGTGPAPERRPSEEPQPNAPMAGQTPASTERQHESKTEVPVAPGRICPVCGLEYPSDSTFCGQDGARLIRRNG